MHYSMRRRILMGLILALLVIMATVGLISYKVALHEADEIFSARLATSARVLESLLARQVEHATINQPVVISLPAELSETDGDEASELGHPYETKLAFQVWSDTGTLLIKSEFSPNERLGPIKEGFWELQTSDTAWHVFTLKSGNVWIEVAEETGLRREIAREIGITLVMPMLLGFAVLIFMVNLIVSLGFNPLAKLAQAIEQRNPKDSLPIHQANAPDELLPVLTALNSLISRVFGALQRESRFTDSVAHELRTPLAAMSVHAENAANSANEDERDLSLAFLLTSIRRTRHLVDQMLTYSRIGLEAESEPLVQVDLVEELKYQISHQQIVHEGIKFNLQIPQYQLTIKAHLGLLEILLKNLLENACKHRTKLESPVDINLDVSEDRRLITIRIQNDANPIPLHDVPRLFEAYYRPSNTSAKGHGLGLAMASEIAQLHGWSLELTQKIESEKIEFAVKIPSDL